MNVNNHITIVDAKTTVITTNTMCTTAVSKTEYELDRTKRTLLDGIPNISDEQ